MRRACLGLLLALVGCRERPRAEAPPPDPELAAIDFLKHHVFAPPESVRDRFTSDRDSADFPLRLLLEGPEQYRFVDLYRMRAIDGRVVVSALVELDGAPNEFELWLELSAGVWRIAGWANAPQTVDPSRPAPESGARVPPDLSPATFRGAPRVLEVPLPTAIRTDGDAGVEAEDPRVRVWIKSLGFDGDCPKRALTRAVKTLARPLARCYVDATGGQRRGRLTARVTFDRGQPPEAYISETTLLNDDLSDCMIRLMKALPPSVGAEANCEVSVPVTFSPR